MTRILSALAASALIACGSSGLDGPPAAFELSNRPLLPFPTDELARPDPNTPTGLRLTVGPEGTNLGDVDEALFLLGDDFIESLVRADGWSTLGPAFAPLSEAADPSSADDHVWLVDLSSRTRIPAQVSVLGGETKTGRPMFWVSARPLVPLAPMTRHTIVLLRGLTTEAGERFGRSETFDALLHDEPILGANAARVDRARARMSGVSEAIAALGKDLDDVLSADTYTTQSIRQETDALVRALSAMPMPEVILDADEDGAPDVYLDPTTDPRGNVPSSGHEHTRALVRLRFQLPNFRKDVDGPLVFEGGEPVLQGFEDVEMIVLVPKGEGPFPVVTYHHGVGDDKESIFVYAKPILERGIAMVAIDGALHGYRTDRPGNAATRFINIVSPELVADNFRQAETDQVWVVRVIDALAKLDLVGDDGRPELDASRLFYLGESLGSIIGAAAIGVEPRYEGAVLGVGGGTLFEFFDRVLSGFAFDGFPTQLFTTVAQTTLDRGDPTNWADASRDKQVLLLQAMQDDVIPAGATESLGRAMGLPIVGVAEHVPRDVAVVPAPRVGRGWTQLSPAGHNVFHARQGETYGRAHGLLVHFLATWAETGTAEIE